MRSLHVPLVALPNVMVPGCCLRSSSLAWHLNIIHVAHLAPLYRQRRELLAMVEAGKGYLPLPP